jgi:hypothetical protein
VHQERDEQIDDYLEGGEEFTDEKTGQMLDSKLVQEARREEVDFMEHMPLYEKVPTNDCWQHAGKA